MAHRNARISFTLIGIAAFAGLSVATPAFAQTSAGMAPVAPTGSAQAAGIPPVSQATIAKAGQAMRDVVSINRTYAARLSASTDPATKAQIVARAKQKAEAAIAGQGLSVGQYNQVLASARQNPALRQRLLNDAGLSDAGSTAQD